jgi:hypothetical protein
MDIPGNDVYGFHAAGGGGRNNPSFDTDASTFLFNLNFTIR